MRLKSLLLLWLLIMLPALSYGYGREGESSPRNATYHIDTREQYHIVEVLESDVRAENGESIVGKPITVKFDCPLGYINAKSEENRSYLDQVVHSITIKLNGMVIPYKETPTRQDNLFWCLDTEMLRGGDQVAIRFTPTYEGVTLRVELDLTRIIRKPTEGNEREPSEPAIRLSENLKAHYQKVESKGNRVDSARLKEFLALNHLWWTPEEPTRSGIERFARFFATYAKYDPYVNSTDINQIFETINAVGRSCNPLSEAYVFGRRVEGGVVRKIGGRNAGSNEGHAIAQEYDTELGTFVTIDLSSLVVLSTGGSKAPYLEQIGKAISPTFIAFQGDVRNGVREGITCLVDDNIHRSQTYLNRCGNWFVSCNGRWVADIFPTSKRGGTIERLKKSNSYYVRYDKAAQERVAMH